MLEFLGVLRNRQSRPRFITLFGEDPDEDFLPVSLIHSPGIIAGSIIAIPPAFFALGQQNYAEALQHILTGIMNLHK
jgi:hypothetical protein